MIDFVDFEETFKLGCFGLKGGDTTPKTMKKKKAESISLLEPNRIRNVGKYGQAGVILQNTRSWLISLLEPNRFRNVAKYGQAEVILQNTRNRLIFLAF